MPEVIIIEPNITREESDRNFKRVEEILEIIAEEIIERELKINKAL